MSFAVGDKVKLYARSYVRGTRRPGFRGKFRYHLLGVGVLLAKDDPKAHEGSSLTGHMTREQLREHFATHVGLINAAGDGVNGCVTEGNNPVAIDGKVIWAYADQIRKLS